MPTDKQLVATKENDGSEQKYIAQRYKIPIDVVRDTMLELGTNGQSARGRARIYAALRAKNYEINTKKATIKKGIVKPEALPIYNRGRNEEIKNPQ